jgi:glycosyltransferase involved in cell wall biosynthesis
MEYPSLSIIVPIYNVEKQIKKCAISLFEQSFQNIEYIFVNDCTRDKSMEILNEVIYAYPEKKEQIVIINHETNKGLSAARSSGLQIAKGEYIAHCDSDDWVDANMYNMMMNTIVNEKSDIVVSGFICEYQHKIVEEGFSSYIAKLDKIKYLNRIYLGGKYSSLCNKIIKKSLYIDNNIHPVEGISMWEDMIVTFRLIFCSQQISILNKSMYHYINNEDSITRSFEQKHIKDQIKCASILDDFLKSQEVTTISYYKIIINKIKFVSKLPYLTNKNIRNVNEWLDIYQESNKYIWKYKEFSIYKRFVYWLASTGFSKVSIIIIDFSSILRKNIKKILR